MSELGGPVAPALALTDSVRQAQGRVLEFLGFGPTESPYDVIAADAHWRLRSYGGVGPPLLIVAAPIKRPYIWDFSPQVSAIGHCLRHHFRPYLLEWTAPASGDPAGGLSEYAGRYVIGAAACVSEDAAGTKPFLIGHSLGGTLAAIAAAYDSQALSGLVLLAAPLCFAPGSSPFRDAMAGFDSSLLAAMDVVPGSALSQLSAAASPDTFVWSRMLDAALSLNDAQASEIHARVERWALDEFPLSGRLAHDIFHSLYRENRFCRGTLPIGSRIVGPSRIQVPTLAIVNSDDAVAPLASVSPFIEAIAANRGSVMTHAGETGVGLQHLAILIGRKAHADVWPQMLAWLRVHE